MADSIKPDNFDSQPESSGNSNDDFEKLDAPGSSYYNEGDTGPHAAADAGAYDYDDKHNQEAEISTTTDLGGEEEAEEDRYAGASEADSYVTHSPEPLISLGDDDVVDPFQVQPSAPPVSELSQPEPLIDIGSSTGPEPDILASFASSTLPSSKIEDPFSTPSSSKPEMQNEDIQHVVESQKESKEILDQTSEDSSKGSWLKGVDPRGEMQETGTSSACAGPCVFKDLIYWRDVRTTGVVFGSMLVVLVSLAIFSLLSVLAYLSLACLAVTFTFVVYKKVMTAVQKSADGHPFKPLLEMDIELKEEKLKSVIDQVLKNVNATTSEVRRLFLIEDLVDSIKFGLLLWVLTYIGSWFNGMTLIILSVILLFTLPKVYETNQAQIDNYIGLAKAQVDNVLKIVQSKVPFLKKKEKPQ
ncbi:reticulon-like protein [Plakobranchus ocellatus]|uniref:Reticulon-like protein n=1 Tax=Plakobranchus ocellatus TaxID=259542 RepID=A0AAV3YR32_9GAST|nr:reticulon-like protein [Plakobranchus ocellatus]